MKTQITWLVTASLLTALMVIALTPSASQASWKDKLHSVKTTVQQTLHQAKESSRRDIAQDLYAHEEMNMNAAREAASAALAAGSYLEARNKGLHGLNFKTMGRYPAEPELREIVAKSYIGEADARLKELPFFISKENISNSRSSLKQYLDVTGWGAVLCLLPVIIALVLTLSGADATGQTPEALVLLGKTKLGAGILLLGVLLACLWFYLHDVEKKVSQIESFHKLAEAQLSQAAALRDAGFTPRH